MTNNQLAENSIIQLLNSVKLARDNAERADNRVDHSFYYALTIALEELQERRKADTEPYGFTDGDRRGMIYKPEHSDRLSEPVPVYRHAQPAPVVPELMVDWQENEFSAGWNACRAAMLQEFQKSAGAEEICRNKENVQVMHTKSPAQSDCCPAQNSVSPAQDGNSPATSDNWQVEAEKLAEMHGMSFVLFRHGEAPQCADPTKVVISFTDKGLGHDALPAAPQGVIHG